MMKLDTLHLDEVPSATDLKKEGFDLSSPGSIIIYGEDKDSALEILRKQGISLRREGEVIFNNSNQSIECEFSRIVDDVLLRVIAKIAFNYLAYNIMREYILRDHFNDFRNYVRRGEPNLKRFVTISNDPIIYGESSDNGPRLLGHLLTLEITDVIVIQVSLFNIMKYVVRFESTPDNTSLNFRRGHFFCPNSRRIIKLGNYAPFMHQG